MDKKKNPSKKEARHQIASKIEAALAHLKEVLGEKEFDERLKKASKIFSKGFKAEAPATKVATPKTTVVTSKGVVKKVAKKAAKKK